jgi:hypothetical protein
MRRITLSSAACPALPYFPLPHKRQDGREKFTENKMCVVTLSANVVWKKMSFWEEFSAILQKRAYVFMCSTGHSCQI